MNFPRQYYIKSPCSGTLQFNCNKNQPKDPQLEHTHLNCGIIFDSFSKSNHIPQAFCKNSENIFFTQSQYRNAPFWAS